MSDTPVIIRAISDRVFLDRRFVLFLLRKLPSYISVDKFFQTMNQMEVRLHNSKTEESMIIIFSTIAQLANTFTSTPFRKFLLPGAPEQCEIFDYIPKPADSEKEPA